MESSSGKGENVKLFKFRDSKLIDSFEPDLIALEAKGLQGSKVLLEGKICNFYFNKGAFNIYVNKILTFFDYLPTPSKQTQ